MVIDMLRCQIAVWSLLTVAGLGACGDGPIEPSLLSTSRVIAIRADPGVLTPGGSHTLQALTYQTRDLRWRACLGPWIPPDIDAGRPELTCSFGEIDAGTGETITVPIPEVPPETGQDLLDVWFLVEGEADTGARTPLLPTLFRLSVGGPTVQPSDFLIGSVTPDGALIDLDPTTVAAGTDIELGAVLDTTHDARAVVTWYTTAGVFEPFRTFGENPTTLTVPSDVESIEVFVVLRNADGGTAWVQRELTVQAPEASQ